MPVCPVYGLDHYARILTYAVQAGLAADARRQAERQCQAERSQWTGKWLRILQVNGRSQALTHTQDSALQWTGKSWPGRPLVWSVRPFRMLVKLTAVFLVENSRSRVAAQPRWAE